MLKDKGDLFQDLFQSVVSWILVHCCRGKNIHPSSQETIIREYINMMTTRKCFLKKSVKWLCIISKYDKYGRLLLGTVSSKFSVESDRYHLKKHRCLGASDSLEDTC